MALKLHFLLDLNHKLALIVLTSNSRLKDLLEKTAFKGPKHEFYKSTTLFKCVVR